ncbi:hypothetical protein [Kaistia soli]|nr:hypothetical protein [Kaistia soli]
MTRLGAEAWFAAAAIWMGVMLPSAAFGSWTGDAIALHNSVQLIRPL